MVSFWNDNKFVIILIVLLVLGALYMAYIHVGAEEIETESLLQDQETDYQADDFTETVTSELSDIKSCLSDIKEIDESTLSLFQDQGLENGKILDDIEDINEKIETRKDGSVLPDDPGQDEPADDPDPGQDEPADDPDPGQDEPADDPDPGQDEPDPSGEEITYQEDLINHLDELHDDNLKIMFSLWALCGLVLGTKLISRMFGNG